jgi:uncharacterized membrane protein
MPDNAEDLREQIKKARQDARARADKERQSVRKASEKLEVEMLKEELDRLKSTDPNDAPPLAATVLAVEDPPADENDKKAGNK